VRGPRRKPAEIEAKQGNPGKRAKRVVEAALAAEKAASGASVAPPVAEEVIVPPADLDPLAAPFWREASRWLMLTGRLKGVESYSLARYCEYYAVWRAARESLRDKRTRSGIRTTYTTKSAHGTMQRQRPEWRTMLDCEREMRQLGDRFGLTPAARASLLSRLAEVRDPDGPKPNGTEATGAAAAVARSQPPAPGTSPIGMLGGRKPH